MRKALSYFRPAIIGALIFSGLAASALLAAPMVTVRDPGPTFNRDVAPLIFEHCSPCHRPGESAPFSLLSYDDAFTRRRQIVEVTISGYMPPWLPGPDGDYPLHDSRKLTSKELRVLADWLELGAPRGPAEPAPLPPAATQGWQLGEPDLIVESAEPFLLPADGLDAYRNFVIPATNSRARWVRAVEIRPGNKRTVHHGILRLDRSPTSREAAEIENGSSFPGMEMPRTEAPGGQFIGWTPGKLPSPGLPGMAFRLEPGSDFVLQLHLLPTGKPEQIRPRIGLFFTDEAPTWNPTEITLYSDEIDIPPGAKDYRVSDSFEFPVDVRLMSIYPHAHYLGRELRATVTLPDGVTRTLLHIPDWDFNWQDDYRFEQEVRLPAGSVVTMDYRYDNSAENPRNPWIPPRRVRHGNRSTDEMASLGLQVRVDGEQERLRLVEAQARAWVARLPDSAAHLNDLGVALSTQGRLKEASESYRRALEIDPGFAEAYYNQGLALAYEGRLKQAVAAWRRALELEPDYAEAHNNLGQWMLTQGNHAAAVEHLRQAVRLGPSLAEAHYNLGMALAAQGSLAGALAAYERAIELDPDSASKRNNLGTVLHRLNRLEEAIARYREAIELDPQFGMSHRNMGLALLQQGKREAGAASLRRALELDPKDAVARKQLDALRARP